MSDMTIEERYAAIEAAQASYHDHAARSRRIMGELHEITTDTVSVLDQISDALGADVPEYGAA